MARDLDKEAIEAAIAGSAQKPLCIDFWGPKCSHCLALMPAVEALAEKYAHAVDLCKVNIQGNRRAALTLKVMGLPAFLFFKDGVEVAALRLSGEAATAQRVEANLQALIG